MKIKLSGLLNRYGNFQQFTCITFHTGFFKIVVRSLQQEI